jgi:hypothetical protein
MYSSSPALASRCGHGSPPSLGTPPEISVAIGRRSLELAGQSLMGGPTDMPGGQLRIWPSQHCLPTLKKPADRKNWFSPRMAV